ncbi:hypothetical protein C0Q70_12098 [Pomacea canaliculata]|uniref:Ig-like domain-containing protein n=1 Tax=Pomacea canaliculata TaxID=400727 RepID=A0A2T7P0K3_POMCA|nr:uncharacterized protein LOC112568303 [Pomacea canaliculata]XP_025101329.1 uncharacterized protein LOC112568303 [Pomacea canaliculata]XP_025101330.1 uncharacterized protein LOC112568303 [Pomacea canaliculata]PVD26950.1 hypothetical protein C0Q70_12098 [Pomacea canaliculata]
MLSSPSGHLTKGVVCFCLCCIAALANRDRPVCDIPPVKKMATAFITCYLPEEISQKKADFTLYHIKDNGSSDAVMNASWIDNEYFIALTPGYVRDGSVKDSRIFTFQIPRVNESHEGTYACRPEGYRDDHVRTCELVLTQNGSRVSETLDTRKSKDEPASEDLYVTNIILMCLNVAFTVFLVVFIVVCPDKLSCIRKTVLRSCCTKSSTETGSNGNETGHMTSPEEEDR